MKKIIALVLALAAASCSTSPAYAATSSLEFTGTAAAFCSFSNITNGALAINTADPKRIGSNYTGGSAATFNISYLGTPTVSVEEVTGFILKPQGVSSSDFSYETTVSSGSSATYTSNGGFLTSTYSSGTADQLSVNMTATKSNGQSVPLGTYSAGIVITCQ